MSPFSRAAAERNKRVLNHVMRPLARVVPGMGLLTHTGRRSGQRYTIPVLVFVREGKVLICLVYGDRTDWVRNVTATGWAGLQVRRRRFTLRAPQVHTDPSFAWASWPVRQVLRRIDADQVLVFGSAVPPPRGGWSRRPLPPVL